jgi:hypothetical protein
MHPPLLIRLLAVLLTITILFQGYVAVAMPFCSHSTSLAASLVQHRGHHHGNGKSHQAVPPLKIFCDNCELCSVCGHVYSLLIPILPFPILSAAVNYPFSAIFFTSFIPDQLQRPPQFSYLF